MARSLSNNVENVGIGSKGLDLGYKYIGNATNTKLHYNKTYMYIKRTFVPE